MNPENKIKRGLLGRYFAFIERRSISEKIIFHVILLAVLFSLVWSAKTINDQITTSVPTVGGTLVEGIVGTPRFVNPVLAITRADHDMVSLVYSGLVKLDKNGELVPDIAESINISEDRRTYNIKLREDVYFHNGTKLTTKDVSYTIALIQNPELKSPLQGHWDGVLVEELGEYELNLILEEPYTPFIENLTVGILPRNLWNELPTEQLPFSHNNTEPIGTGPYQIVNVVRNKSGLINAYYLEATQNYQGKANITNLVFNFYQNEEDLVTALTANEITSTASLSNIEQNVPDTSKYQILEETLPRTFAIYFNQNRSTVLRDNSVREALNAVIDRDDLINEVLDGYGVSIDSPIPPGFIELPESTSTATTEGLDKMTLARSILTDGGWTQNENGQWVKAINEEDELILSVSISTSNTPLFESTANYVADVWRSLGAEVEVSQFAQTDLVQAVIRPRSFEALLFGAEVGRSIELYPFWHSSQKDDPGLNIAEYANIDADAILEDIRVESDKETRAIMIAEVTKLIDEDQPAVFLFSPTFRYLLDQNVQTTPLSKMSDQSDRFSNINTWHIRSNNVWPIFQ